MSQNADELNKFGLTELEIAKITHQANKAFCEICGDNSQPEWEAAPEWQKSSAVDGVRFHLLHPNASNEASHNNWLAEKEASGWVYGEVKDPEAKTHPCIVPFAELPPQQQFKDVLFASIVKGYANFTS